MRRGESGAGAPLGLLGRRQYRRISRFEGLPEVSSPRVRVQTVPVRMSDGVDLVTEIWHPETPRAGAPVVLMRLPYGAMGMRAFARIFAERGYPVVLQNCRGTFGSGGEFEPFFNEERDGVDCCDWLAAQPWAAGGIHTFGASYFGLTQWAIAHTRHPALRSMTIGVSTRSFGGAIMYPGGGFGIETAVSWAHGLAHQERSTAVRLGQALQGYFIVPRSAMAADPSTAVRQAIGHDLGYYQDWLAHSDAGDPWWARVDFVPDALTVPHLQLAGWQDLFLEGQLKDVEALTAAGTDVRLIVGPWTHASPQMGELALVETFALLSGEPRPAARIFLHGANRWVDLAQWPPAATPWVLHLRSSGELDEEPDPDVSEVSYRYDPADPTPAAGGRGLSMFTAGVKNQKVREKRADVLTWTTRVLPEPVTVIGRPTAKVVIASSNPRVDVFVRLCLVDPKGRSTNITDGYRRLDAPGPGEGDGARVVELDLAPTAYEVPAGHRLRVQISSGAHPLYLRNPGTADPLRDFSELVPSEQQVVLGPDGCSITLPVTDLPL